MTPLYVVGFCPGEPKHKGITIVRSLFVLCVRSSCLAAVYCWSFVSTLVHRYTRTEPVVWFSRLCYNLDYHL